MHQNDNQRLTNKRGSAPNQEDSNFNIVENIEMYIKAQGSDEDLNSRKRFSIDDDLNHEAGFVPKNASQDMIFT